MGVDEQDPSGVDDSGASVAVEEPKDPAIPEPDAPRSGIRWWSTPESAANGEISVLAIAETVVAVSIAIWVALKYQTVAHIVVGACVAPFLLLRTEESTRLAFSWMGKGGLIDRYLDLWTDVAGRSVSWWANLGNVLKVVFLPVAILAIFMSNALLGAAFFVVRVGVTIATALRSPVQCLRAVPVNWKRISWCTDFHHPPEVLPGFETADVEEHESMCGGRFVEFLEMITEEKRESILGSIFGWFFYLALFLFTFLPSLLYRLSLKSTTVIYFPFIWIIHSHVGEETPARSALRDLTEGKLERLKRWYGWFIVVVTAGSMLSLEFAPSFLVAWANDDCGPVTKVLMDIFIPVNWETITIKGWHVARFLNAGIFIYLFFYADKAKRRIDDGEWSEGEVLKRLRGWRNVTVFLALYTTACALGRVVAYVFWETLPPVSFEIFPF